jgi:AAA+ ATPase superfamily predicted ATPase
MNRNDELDALDKWWSGRGAAMAVVLGRRRVGKSWLLKKWAADKRAVLHVARNRSATDELVALSRAVAAVAPPRRRDLLARPFTDLDDAFETLAELAETEPLLVVLDEFPELCKAMPGLESALRSIWERVEGTCKLKMVLCGSAVRAMEALQTEDAPLFNRMTLRLPVHPFRVHEISKLLPTATPVERAEAWGVCGGMPFYLSAWQPGVPLKDNLAHLFCNEHALLLGEGEFVLATEDVAGGGRDRIPEQVLRAIADGHTSFSEIKSVINTLPTRALASLEELRLIAKVQPVTAKPSTKLSYYRVADNFLAFWLGVVEAHRPAIEQGLGPSLVNVVAAQFDDFMGARWEDALREHVRLAAASGDLDRPLVAVGEFWRRQAGPMQDPCQLDVVALTGRSRKVALAGEAKWGRRKSAAALVGDVKRKATQAKLELDANPLWLACAREELTNVPDDCVAVTAHDIFA